MQQKYTIEFSILESVDKWMNFVSYFFTKPFFFDHFVSDIFPRRL